MTLRNAIRDAAERLAATSDTPRLDAELLAAHALGVTREALLLGHMDVAVPDGFAALVARRAASEPLAYITGTRDFWTITLKVRPGVLIPRPDSETLIDAALSHFGTGGPRTVLDLGTGSGALLLAVLAEWPTARGLGIDRMPDALAIAQENATTLGFADRVQFRLGNWGEGVDARFDLILCNPPYIESDAVLAPDVAAHEPATALFAGADGLDDYRVLAPQVGRLLSPDGVALFEIGATQGTAVRSLFEAQGFATRLLHDLAGRDRCVAVTFGHVSQP